MSSNVHTLNVMVQIAVILILAYLIYLSTRDTEGLCIKKDYGYVTDVPASIYADANSALVHSSSLGQAPLGDPRHWLFNRSPITQGQYGLYQQNTLPLSETQPFDRRSLEVAARALPVYTEKPLPPQCTPLN